MIEEEFNDLQQKVGKLNKVEILDGELLDNIDALAAAKERQKMSKAIQRGEVDTKLYRGEKNYATYVP